MWKGQTSAHWEVKVLQPMRGLVLVVVMVWSCATMPAEIRAGDSECSSYLRRLGCTLRDGRAVVQPMLHMLVAEPRAFEGVTVIVTGVASTRGHSNFLFIDRLSYDYLIARNGIQMDLAGLGPLDDVQDGLVYTVIGKVMIDRKSEITNMPEWIEVKSVQRQLTWPESQAEGARLKREFEENERAKSNLPTPHRKSD